MAGYFLYTLDGDAFTQLTTTPTDEQAQVIASHLQQRAQKSKAFPGELPALTEAVKSRLASPDWYANLNEVDGEIWDNFVFSLRDEVGEQVGIGFECTDYESIYWDCAEECVAQGAAMLQEPRFSCSGYRFHGDLAHDWGYHRIYSIFDAATVKQLLDELSQVEPHFAALPDDGDGGLHDQFFEGLLKPVQDTAKRGRCLFVQTDT